MDRQGQIDRIMAEFQRLGVSSQEVRAYLALLQEEGVSGYRLSKNAGIHSSKIYGVLSRLMEKGFVVATDTRPVKYFACPPEELLDRIEKELVATVSTLGRALMSLDHGKKANDTLAWNITGRANVIHKAREIINGSIDSIFLAIWAKELRPLRSALSSAVKRGVKLRVVAYGKTNFDQGTIYFHRPTDYPFRERGERRFVLISDNNKAVIANIGPQGSDNGLWTENRGLVLLFRDFVIHEIYIVQIEEAYPQEIEKLVGRDWEKVRLA
ncbi:MAG: TrmB family transcriptional regulator [Deltaproteobacteria bacterium]|nr:TrmB family transcriptional regulator [Deltaproteobacteria bacterium]